MIVPVFAGKRSFGSLVPGHFVLLVGELFAPLAVRLDHFLAHYESLLFSRIKFNCPGMLFVCWPGECQNPLMQSRCHHKCQQHTNVDVVHLEPWPFGVLLNHTLYATKQISYSHFRTPDLIITPQSKFIYPSTARVDFYGSSFIVDCMLRFVFG